MATQKYHKLSKTAKGKGKGQGRGRCHGTPGGELGRERGTVYHSTAAVKAERCRLIIDNLSSMIL